jgi:hypothetical protein
MWPEALACAQNRWHRLSSLCHPYYDQAYGEDDPLVQEALD